MNIQRFLTLFMLCPLFNSKIIWCLSNEKEIPAFGRKAQLGSLYDARIQSFPNINIRKSQSNSESEEYVETTNVHFTTENFKLINTMKDKFGVLTPEPESEIIVGVATGEVKVGGVFEFLKYKDIVRDHRSDFYLWFKMVKNSKEHWQIESKGVEREINFSLLRLPKATHIVTGITYGGGIAATLKFSSNRTTLQNIPQFMTTDNEMYPHGSQPESLQIFSDFSIGNQTPTTFNEVRNLVRTLPNLITGRGVAMAYTLTPISEFMYNFPYADFSEDSDFDSSEDNNFLGQYSIRPDFTKHASFNIDSTIFETIENILDQISLTYRNLEDFSSSLHAHSKCLKNEDLFVIVQLKTNFVRSSNNFIQKLKSLIPAVRSGTNHHTELTITTLIDQYKTSESFSYIEVQKSLKTNFQSILNKIQFYKGAQRQNIQYLGRDSPFSQIFQTKTNKTYILYAKNIFGIESSQAWNGLIAQFFLLGKNHENSLWIVDCDFKFRSCNPLNRPVIHEYQFGYLTNSNYEGMRENLTDVDVAVVAKLEEQIQNLTYVLRNEIDMKGVQIIDILTRAPEAQFFTLPNFRGAWEGYRLSPRKFTFKDSCLTLQYVANNVSSINTFGTCIRIFKEKDCKGESLLVFPLHQNVQLPAYPNLWNKIQSVGSCFPSIDIEQSPAQTITMPALTTTTTTTAPTRTTTTTPTTTTPTTTTTFPTTTMSHTHSFLTSGTMPSHVPMPFSPAIMQPIPSPWRAGKAMFFGRTGYRGPQEQYNDDPYEEDMWECYNLAHLAGKVKSIKTFDTCVQIFENLNCNGIPTMINQDYEELHSMFRVRSVNQCI